jgi:hypothetical protein
MGIDRYSSSDFVDGKVVNNGQIGNLYGIDIFVSSNCPIIETAAANSAGGDVKQAMLFHKDSMVLAEQMGVRSQTQYKQDFLATLYTADTLYGTAVLRNGCKRVVVTQGVSSEAPFPFFSFFNHIGLFHGYIQRCRWLRRFIGQFLSTGSHCSG